MNTIGYRVVLALFGLVFVVTTALPAMAQDKDEKEVKKEVTVKVDEDGNVTINGKPANDGEMELPDGSRVIVDRENGRAIIIEEDDGGRKIIRRRVHAPGDMDEHDNVLIFEADGDDGHRMKRRIWVTDPDNDDEEVEVMLERLGEAPHGLANWHEMDMPRRLRAMVRHPRTAMFVGEDDFDFDFDFDGPDKELMKLEVETHKLASKIARAEGDERQQLARELSEKLNEIFDMKLEHRTKHVEKLQQRLEEERRELEKRSRSRAEIIERRKAELLGDDDLEW